MQTPNANQARTSDKFAVSPCFALSHSLRTQKLTSSPSVSPPQAFHLSQANGALSANTTPTSSDRLSGSPQSSISAGSANSSPLALGIPLPLATSLSPPSKSTALPSPTCQLSPASTYSALYPDDGVTSFAAFPPLSSSRPGARPTAARRTTAGPEFGARGAIEPAAGDSASFGLSPARMSHTQLSSAGRLTLPIGSYPVCLGRRGRLSAVCFFADPALRPSALPPLCPAAPHHIPVLLHFPCHAQPSASQPSPLPQLRTTTPHWPRSCLATLGHTTARALSALARACTRSAVSSPTSPTPRLRAGATSRPLLPSLTGSAATAQPRLSTSAGRWASPSARARPGRAGLHPDRLREARRRRTSMASVRRRA